MPAFPSLEWMQRYAELLSEHKDVDTMARGLDGIYRFVIDAGRNVPERHSYEIEIRPGSPPIVEARPSTSARAVLEVGGLTERWRELVEGRTDLLTAVLLRRIRVSGDWASLRSRLKDATPLMDALHEVDTIWPGSGGA